MSRGGWVDTACEPRQWQRRKCNVQLSRRMPCLEQRSGDYDVRVRLVGKHDCMGERRTRWKGGAPLSRGCRIGNLTQPATLANAQRQKCTTATRLRDAKCPGYCMQCHHDIGKPTLGIPPFQMHCMQPTYPFAPLLPVHSLLPLQLAGQGAALPRLAAFRT